MPKGMNRLESLASAKWLPRKAAPVAQGTAFLETFSLHSAGAKTLFACSF